MANGTQCLGVPYAQQLQTGCVVGARARRKLLREVRGNTFHEKLDTLESAAPTCAREPARGQAVCVLSRGAGIAPKDMDLVAPAPRSWRAQPEQWLTNLDIDRFLEYVARSFPATVTVPFSTIDFDSKDPETGRPFNPELVAFDAGRDLRRAGKTHLVACVNLGKAGTGGIHWMALYLFGGSAAEAPFVYYFDSAISLDGDFPPSVRRQHARWARQLAAAGERRVCALRTNKRRHQRGNNNCGMYALYFLALMASPLQEPLRFPVRPPARRGLGVDADDDRSLHPVFASQEAKLRWLDAEQIPDADMQFYRDEFFRS